MLTLSLLNLNLWSIRKVLRKCVYCKVNAILLWNKCRDQKLHVFQIQIYKDNQSFDNISFHY